MEASFGSLEDILGEMESGGGILHSLVYDAPADQDVVFRVMQAATRFNSIQSDIGGLGRSDVWRGSGESSDSDQDLSDAEAVMAVLEEFENSESPD